VYRLAILVAAGVAFAAAAWTATSPRDAALPLLLAAGALVAAGVAWLESGPDSAREIAVVATLGGVAAAGRVLFAAVPGVQPVTVICVAAGAGLGARAGIAVGAVAAFVSNLFLGQGLWTPWQMLGWAAFGAIGALLAPLIRLRIPFALLCTVLGFAFSGLMDIWNWYSFVQPHAWATFVLYVWTRGLPFDVAHAAGNLVIALAAGPELRRMLDRYRRRLHVEVVWA
jgi:energy-coupling factor transport system substrate-specific component